MKTNRNKFESKNEKLDRSYIHFKLKIRSILQIIMLNNSHFHSLLTIKYSKKTFSQPFLRPIHEKTKFF